MAFEWSQHDLQQVREENRRRQLLFERELLEQKLRYQKEMEAALPDQVPETTPSQGDVVAKLPKLEITKFNGPYEAWLSFWGKFSAEISGLDRQDSSGLAAVTKFDYLRELLELSVWLEISRGMKLKFLLQPHK